MDKNRELHELLGLEWKIKWIFTGAAYEERSSKDNPDYAADPRLVLREMMKREDWLDFRLLMNRYSYDHLTCIEIELILDPTGKLRDMAIEWLKGEKNESRK